MTAFDRIREADARRRIAADVGRLTSYSLAVAEAPADPAEEVLPTLARWEGIIGMEDELTGDARKIEGGALRWELEGGTLPLRYVQSDVGFHDGAEDAGNIDTIERRPGGVIWGSGEFHMNTDAGRAAYVAVRDEITNGVSMDLDDVSFEIRVAGELFDQVEAMFDEDGDVEVAGPERNADGTVTVVKVNSDDEVQVTTAARVRASTIVSIPAFANARIHVVEVSDEEAAAADPVAAAALAADVEDLSADPVRNALAARDGSRVPLLAAAAPLAPPEEWFKPIAFTEPTPLYVGKDGRVYGHIALWGTCHVSHSAGGKCVTPPNSPSDYAWFHTGALETAEGSLIGVGHLTMNTGHAADDLSIQATMAHYDNTGTVAADVRAYEDDFGIAVVGGLRPTLSPNQVRAFRAAPASGDWRYVGAHLELVAVLSVNVPGFGVPRPSGFVRGGELVSLTASGVIFPVNEASVHGLSDHDVTYLRSFIDRERRHELDTLAATRNRAAVERFARARRRHKKG